MIRLPQIVLLLATLATVLLSSCNEASFAPIDDPSDAVKRIIVHKWVFNGDQTLPHDTTKSRNGWVLDLRADGSYFSSSPNSSSTSGRWTYNNGDSSLTLEPGNGTATTTFKIDSVSKTSIKLKGPSPNDVIYLRSQTGPLFSISGPLVYEKSLPILSKHRLSVLWKASGTDDEAFVWGEGSIDVIGNQYRVDFNTYPPDSLIARFYGCNGKIGIGTIYLHADKTVGASGSRFTGRMPAQTIGIVKDRALIFLFGQFDGTQCSIEFPWVSSFQRGFSIGEAFYSLTDKDKYIPTNGSVNQLVVSDVASTFQTPAWWK